MDINLTDQAINQALKCNWTEAIKINQQILKNEPENTDALNRLARAYYETGNIKSAKKTSLQVLKVEPTNKIAKKALEKYIKVKGGNLTSSNQNINVSDFIEETGTTKQTTLINLCSEELISSLDSGDEVLLSAHSHRVTVTTLKNKYLGKLPDDLSAKLRNLIKNGYKYRVLIKSADKNCIKVIIKEIKRGKNFENIHSFPHETSESVGEFGS